MALDLIRKRNKEIASRCHYCKNKSIGINAVAEQIVFVCTNHYIPDNPNVIHRIYPDGMPYPEHMLDPNIGGHFSKPKGENNE